MFYKIEFINALEYLAPWKPIVSLGTISIIWVAIFLNIVNGFSRCRKQIVFIRFFFLRLAYRMQRRYFVAWRWILEFSYYFIFSHVEKCTYVRAWISIDYDLFWMNFLTCNINNWKTSYLLFVVNMFVVKRFRIKIFNFNNQIFAQILQTINTNLQR